MSDLPNINVNRNKTKEISNFGSNNKTNSQDAKISSENYSVLKKKFNLLREEIKGLKDVSNPCKMTSKLAVTKNIFKKSRAKVLSYSQVTNQINFKKFDLLSQVEESEAKFFLEQMSNPCLGQDYLAKMFPKLKDPKYKNKLYKNENKFKSNYQSRALENSLVGFIVNKESDDRKYLNPQKTKLAQIRKVKMRWKTMKWLIENKKDCLDRLMKFQETLLTSSKKKAKKDEGLSKHEFSSMMISNGITNDQDLINKLFWIFDENGDGDLKYSEIAFGVEMFRDSPMEQKLKSFFDLCDVDGSGTISKNEFIDLFKKNIINNDERVNVKQAVDKIFKSLNTNENGEITFQQLMIGCTKYKDIYDIIDKNLMALKSIDMIIDNDVKNDINSFNPDINETLRIKLLNQRVVFIPSRDRKFEYLIEDFIKNKELMQETKILTSKIDENSFEDEL